MNMTEYEKISALDLDDLIFGSAKQISSER
jgi:hypothetical protein